jgi:hypothetical protein
VKAICAEQNALRLTYENLVIQKPSGGHTTEPPIITGMEGKDSERERGEWEEGTERKWRG